MQIDGFDVAHNYAKAFLKVWYVDRVPDIVMEQLRTFYGFLSKKSCVMALLSSPTIKPDDCDVMAGKVCSSLNLDNDIERLVSLVLANSHGYLLPLIIWNIIREGMSRRNECACEIISSQTLSHDMRDKIVKKISGIVGGDIIPDFSVDKSMICGLRIKSDQFFWEKSIAKKLNLFARSIEFGARYA